MDSKSEVNLIGSFIDKRSDKIRWFFFTLIEVCKPLKNGETLSSPDCF